MPASHAVHEVAPGWVSVFVTDPAAHAWQLESPHSPGAQLAEATYMQSVLSVPSGISVMLLPVAELQRIQYSFDSASLLQFSSESARQLVSALHAASAPARSRPGPSSRAGK